MTVVPPIGLINMLLPLLLVHSLVARPMAKYGPYSPYPPPKDQLSHYEFTPIEAQGQAQPGAKSRATRDLTWRDNLDAYLAGSKEPSCEDLREMWHVARELNSKGSMQHDLPFMAFSETQNDEPLVPQLPEVVSSSLEESSQHHNMKADRRRMSTPNSLAASQASQKPKTQTSLDEVSPSLASNVQGVRDPYKDVYGLLRERSTSGSRTNWGPVTYGKVHTHQPASSEAGDSSFLDLIKQKLRGSEAKAEVEVEAEPEYGVIHNFAPATQPSSSFDKLRDLMAASSSPASAETEDKFDLIRQSLMNQPVSKSRALLSPSTKALRRKELEKKRRRNIREIALEHQRWAEMMERQQQLEPDDDDVNADDDEKRRKARKERRKNRRRRRKLAKLHRRQRQRAVLLKKLRDESSLSEATA